MFRIILQVFYIISILFLFLSCSQFRGQSGDRFVENLNLQIKSGSFEQIYNEINKRAKSLTPKEEFLEKMTTVINKIKEADESLSWQKDEKVLLSNGDIAADLYFVHRKVENNGKKLDITIIVAYDTFTPELFDLCVSTSESRTTEYETCVTNALSKI